MVSSLSARSLGELVNAARDTTPVSGLTHNFYRYPARFSPKFVRTAIEAFTEPGDLILDPFMGGGTTLVEAMALGRHALGVDISSLATFVSQTKTTIFSPAELVAVSSWTKLALSQIDMHAPLRGGDDHADPTHYRRHLGSKSTWRLRKAIEQSLEATKSLKSKKLESFTRCAILRTAQWALDGRRNLPSIQEFRTTLANNVEDMVVGANQLRDAARNSSSISSPTIRCLNRSAVGLGADPAVRGLKKPKLVLTSPPYPGIHVLYHRWQVDGRKETAAPFWIANKLDGAGASYYTMGSHHAKELQSYFRNLSELLTSTVEICDDATVVVQVVAFSQPEWQLPRYLSVAEEAGLKEFFLPNLKRESDGRLWRTVPNRKWYANQKGTTHGSKEVVLFHRLSA
jgi:hypothetical protein